TSVRAESATAQVTGRSPAGVQLRIRPTRATSATLAPRVRVVRSAGARVGFGKRAAVTAKPGRANASGRPRTARTIEPVATTTEVNPSRVRAAAPSRSRCLRTGQPCQVVDHDVAAVEDTADRRVGVELGEIAWIEREAVAPRVRFAALEIDAREGEAAGKAPVHHEV